MEPCAVGTGPYRGGLAGVVTTGRAAGEGEQSLKWGVRGPHVGKGQQAGSIRWAP